MVFPILSYYAFQSSIFNIQIAICSTGPPFLVLGLFPGLSSYAATFFAASLAYGHGRHGELSEDTQFATVAVNLECFCSVMFQGLHIGYFWINVAGVDISVCVCVKLISVLRLREYDICLWR